MKPVHYITIIIIVAISSLFAWDSGSHFPIRVFRRSGEVELGGTRIFADTITCTTGNAMTIDISSAGFSTVPRVQVSAMKNTADPLLSPQVSIKSVSTTSISFNVTEFSGTTLLGIAVGTIQFVASPSTVLLNVQAVGN